MAKELIVLTRNSNGTEETFSVAMWYSITSGALAVTANSAWSGASSAENSAIANGSVIEEVRSFTFPVGEPATAIKATLQQAWTERNAQLGGVGPAVYEGIFLDSATGWSA